MFNSIGFMHIGKCSGTSIRFLLQKIFPAFTFYKTYSELEGIDFRHQNNYVISGHFTFNEIASRLNGSKYYFSMFRNPIFRTISHYNYYRVFPEELALREPNKENIFFIKEHSLKECLLNPLLALEFNNRMSRHFLDENSLGESHEEIYFNQSLLNTIKIAIDKFDFVGITEHFESSLVFLKTVFQSDSQINYVHENAYADLELHGNLKTATFIPRVKIPVDTIRLIASKNDLDIEIYNYAISKHSHDCGYVVDLRNIEIYASDFLDYTNTASYANKSLFEKQVVRMIELREKIISKHEGSILFRMNK